VSALSSKEVDRIKRLEALDLLADYRPEEGALPAALRADRRWVASMLTASRTSYHARAAENLGWEPRESELADAAHLECAKSALVKLANGRREDLDHEELVAAELAARRSLVCLFNLEPIGVSRLNVLANRQRSRKAADLRAALKTEQTLLEARLQGVERERGELPSSGEQSAPSRPELTTLTDARVLPVAGHAPEHIDGHVSELRAHEE